MIKETPADDPHADRGRPQSRAARDRPALIAAGDVEARERLNEGLPTSGLAVIDFAGDDWDKLHPRSGRLERFVTPRLLKAATD